MRLSQWGLLVVLSVGLARGSEHFSPIDQKVLALMGQSTKSDLSIVGADRSAVIARLKELASGKIDHNGTASLAADDAEIVLMRLGDSPTTQEVVSQYQKYNSQYSLVHVPDLLEWSHQPDAITYLAPDFDLNYDPLASTKLRSDSYFIVTDPARSIFSAIICLDIIKKAPEFNSGLKAWASDAYKLRFKDPEGFRRLMQAWWMENKDAFSRKEYSAVRPIDLTSIEDSKSTVPQHQVKTH